MDIAKVAKVCYDANRSYCASIGDHSQLVWEDAPEWQRSSAFKGVLFHFENPNASPSASHDSWLKEKIDNGWVHGLVKDPEKKEHPCIVPFDQLPLEQQKKDILFKAVVDALR